jgi:hypothetical protein
MWPVSRTASANSRMLKQALNLNLNLNLNLDLSLL